MDWKTASFISGNDMAEVLDFIDLSVKIGTEEELVGLVKRLGRLIPFSLSTCVWAKVRNGGAVSFRQMNVNYPEEWSSLYHIKKFHQVDPIFREHFRSFGLQYWADTYKKDEPPEEFLGLASDFGLRKGYTCGLRNLPGTEASLISISGDELEKDVRSGFILRQTVPHVHSALERISREKKREKLPRLTSRELEVLKWLAHGKTAWEVSVILKISERTVRFHTANAVRKMDAVSSIHAAAMGLHLGLIELG